MRRPSLARVAIVCAWYVLLFAAVVVLADFLATGTWF